MQSSPHPCYAVLRTQFPLTWHSLTLASTRDTPSSSAVAALLRDYEGVPTLSATENCTRLIHAIRARLPPPPRTSQKRSTRLSSLDADTADTAKRAREPHVPPLLLWSAPLDSDAFLYGALRADTGEPLFGTYAHVVRDALGTQRDIVPAAVVGASESPRLVHAALAYVTSPAYADHSTLYRDDTLATVPDVVREHIDATLARVAPAVAQIDAVRIGPWRTYSHRLSV